ncbi:MAG: transposase [Clostridiales bacterium]|nr:transposase [Clostridiales bacterium]
MRVKKSGIKIHIGIDVLGLAHAIMVTTANVTDRKGAIEMVLNYKNVTSNLDYVLKVLVDSGYTGDKFSDAIKDLISA